MNSSLGFYTGMKAQETHVLSHGRCILPCSQFQMGVEYNINEFVLMFNPEGGFKRCGGEGSGEEEETKKRNSQVFTAHFKHNLNHIYSD